QLLEQAMVHRSYLNEHPSFPTGHNERLEFLGDAVLELVVTEHLYKHYENPEGELTNWRASLVNSRQLSEVANALNIEPHLHLSRGEQQDQNSKARQSILANACEAIIGAIYLDQCMKKAKSFIDQHILCYLSEILEKKLYLDPKSRFQEATQERLSLTPTYRVLEESGPDHNKHFKVGVFVGEELYGTGIGSSKQEAQTNASHDALAKTNW
ncbi:MAG: ribonuclease III, partial [Candidatus Kerfeldbacteria bacterium]|nr:ribonuclease III [Candidatus Kerfeldbacteria bacterium]